MNDSMRGSRLHYLDVTELAQEEQRENDANRNHLRILSYCSK